MKKFTILLLFVISSNAFAQSKKDLRDRGESVLYSVDYSIEHGQFTDKRDAFVFKKIKALTPVFHISEEQKKQLENLFQSQYGPLADAVKNYSDAKNTKAKLDLISMLVKNEEDFRALLTKEQAMAYADYGKEYANAISLEYHDFQRNFMSFKQLESYKKELR